MNGSHYERVLAAIIADQSGYVIRAPASGASTSRDLPDLFWSAPGNEPVAAELKCTSRNVVYYNHEEVTSLQRFAQAFDARPRLVGRFAQDTTFYCWRIDDARITDSGRFACDRDIKPEIAISEDWIQRNDLEDKDTHE